jgi:glycine/D-amino acid oxidase-like deaminating enzyme
LARPGKLVLYRHQKDFDHARARVERQGAGPEQALGPHDCRRVEPALTHSPVAWAGGIFTEGEAVADCHAVCLQLASALAQHRTFDGFVQAEVTGFQLQQRQARAVLSDQGPIGGDAFVLAAGIGSRPWPNGGHPPAALPAQGLQSERAPIAAHHHPPEVSVTDFGEKSAVHPDRTPAARGRDGGPGRSPRRDRPATPGGPATGRACHPARGSRLRQAEPWAGLRPATPAGAHLGASPVEHLWLNVGHGALGFTFSFGSARILSRLIAGQPSPPLPGWAATASCMSAPTRPLTAEALAEALRQAVLARDFGATPDALEGGGPVRHCPSLDLAVVAFPERAPVAANVLFSRDLPQGCGPPRARLRPGGHVRYLADQTDALFSSVAWQPEAQWNAMAWTPLPTGARQTDPQAPRFVQPYPASLLKLMVLVAVARVDHDEVLGRRLRLAEMTRPVRTWAMDMMAQSSNEATSAMVALLHRCGMIRRAGGVEVHNGWHDWMARHGLHTLRLADTTPEGGWQNPTGAGVGHCR